MRALELVINRDDLVIFQYKTEPHSPLIFMRQDLKINDFKSLCKMLEKEGIRWI